MAYSVTQVPHFGFYPESAGYINAKWAAHRTSVTARGSNIAEESFEYPINSGSYISSYNSWCAALAAAGTKMIRVIWSGRNRTVNPPIYNVEPPPHHTYNVWHSALDDTNLTTFRSQQVSGMPGDPTFPIAYWNTSNIKELLDACDSNGIEVIIELAIAGEWSSSGWYYHAWNYNNKYLSGATCAAADRGFLSDRTQVFTDADALQAMKDRISFIVNLVGGYKCVCMWGICSEGNWCFQQDFWYEPSFNTAVIDNIRNYVVP